jgi:hypothetical protein
VCNAAFTCVACGADAQCVTSPGNADQCVGGSCKVCDTADTAGCTEASATPICSAATNTCVACQNDPECANRPGSRDLCVGGTCNVCDPATGRGCVAQVCNAQQQCVACTGNADCNGHQNGDVCSGGLCVDCGAHADCMGRICMANVCVPCANNGDCVSAGIGTTCNNGTCQ